MVQEGMPPVCCKCYSLSNDRGIVRMITRFYLKHTAAHLLQAKLFRESQVEALLQEVRGSTMYQQACEKEFDTMFKLDLRALQQYVRTQFMSVPKNKQVRQGRGYVGTCFQLSSLASGSSSSSGAVGSEEQQQAADASGFLPLAASAASQEASQATEGQQAWEQAGQATTVHPMTYDAANLHYAMEMLECLVWDPAVPRIPRYSLCSLRDT